MRLCYHAIICVQHYAAWYNGSTTGAASVHIDTRGPNGDGDIKDTRCSKWP